MQPNYRVTKIWSRDQPAELWIWIVSSPQVGLLEFWTVTRGPVINWGLYPVSHIEIYDLGGWNYEWLPSQRILFSVPYFIFKNSVSAAGKVISIQKIGAGELAKGSPHCNRRNGSLAICQSLASLLRIQLLAVFLWINTCEKCCILVTKKIFNYTIQMTFVFIRDSSWKCNEWKWEGVLKATATSSLWIFPITAFQKYFWNHESYVVVVLMKATFWGYATICHIRFCPGKEKESMLGF